MIGYYIHVVMSYADGVLYGSCLSTNVDCFVCFFRSQGLHGGCMAYILPEDDLKVLYVEHVISLELTRFFSFLAGLHGFMVSSPPITYIHGCCLHVLPASSLVLISFVFILQV